MDILIDESSDSPDADLLTDSLQKEIRYALSTLTARESDILSYYYGLNGSPSLTLEEIGEKFSLTRERVRQIKEKATRTLRHSSRSKTLRPYLG